MSDLDFFRPLVVMGTVDDTPENHLPRGLADICSEGSGDMVDGHCGRMNRGAKDDPQLASRRGKLPASPDARVVAECTICVECGPSGPGMTAGCQFADHVAAVSLQRKV